MNSKWISVDKKLPRREGKYLVFLKDGNFDILIWNNNTYLLDDGWWTDVHYRTISSGITVTHWQQLPQQPE